MALIDTLPRTFNMEIPVSADPMFGPLSMIHFTHDDGWWGLAHVCPREDGSAIRIALRVPDARVEFGPEITTPEVTCPDCGLHGAVVRSVWEEA